MSKNLVLTAEFYPIEHVDNCPNKKISDLALAELDKYGIIMYNKFVPAKTDEERCRYIKKALQAKFWTENMFENITPQKCDGCGEVIAKYIHEPLDTAHNLLKRCFIEDDDIKDKITGHLGLLRDVSAHSEHVEQLHEVWVKTWTL